MNLISANSSFRLLITHNILWSKYKGAVFSALAMLAKREGIDVRFVQIAESEADRAGLPGVDLSYHQYPYKLLFKGSYDAVPQLKLITACFLEVWRARTDLVLIAGYHKLEFWAMLLAARLRGMTIGVFCDSTMYDRRRLLIRTLFKRIFFSQCDVFFGYGQRAREYLISNGAPNDAIFYRCQAAALPHNYVVASVLAERSELRIEEHLRYLYVGRLSPEKNLPDLLHAFKSVLLAYPEARLAVVGSGPLKSQLIALAERLGLESAVEFLGAKDVEDLRREYLKACCLVLPSYSEAWGLVVNEALSYGCPVVVSFRCGCVPELVIDGETGFSFECGNIHELSAKLIAVPEIFADTATTAQQCIKVIRKFSPENAAQQILNGSLYTLTRSK